MTCLTEVLWSRPTLSRFVCYKLLTLIPVSAALIAITRYAESLVWAGVYVTLCLVHATVMNAIKCPHCAYYKMGDKTFRCHIWWNTPRLYKPRSSPESRLVGWYTPIGMAVLTGFPMFWLWHEWELLFIYLLSIAVFVLSIGNNECPRCLNFQCSHNTVRDRLRKEYLQTISRSGDSVMQHRA